MKRAIITAIALGLSVPVMAQVYKCNEGGKVVYSQMPCGNDHKVLDIRRSSPRPGSFEAEVERRTEYVRKNPGILEPYQVAIKMGVVIPGMTEEQALVSMGRPSRMNLTQTLNGSRWQWVYESPGGGMKFVYIENGLVVATN